MEIASRASGKHLPLPPLRQPLYLALTYSPAEAALIRRGFIPRDMDDKWSIFAKGEWLYFHRSWTGFCIFALRLDTRANGVLIREGWANRDMGQYGGTDVIAERHLITELIRSKLLERAD